MMMMARMSGHLVIMVVVTSLHLARAGLLGAGTGEGSCAAPPFRSVLQNNENVSS